MNLVRAFACCLCVYVFLTLSITRLFNRGKTKVVHLKLHGQMSAVFCAKASSRLKLSVKARWLDFCLRYLLISCVCPQDHYLKHALVYIYVRLLEYT